jgi:hypothetical protein
MTHRLRTLSKQQLHHSHHFHFPTCQIIRNARQELGASYLSGVSIPTTYPRAAAVGMRRLCGDSAILITALEILGL